MKQTINKIMAVFMAFVVLFSTMSFTVGQHYCGDMLVDTALFSKADDCGMQMKKTTVPSDCSMVKNNCCKDVEVLVQGQHELKISLDTLTFKQQTFVASFIISYRNLFKDFSIEKNFDKDYIPPLIVKSIHKLDATYLI